MNHLRISKIFRMLSETNGMMSMSRHSPVAGVLNLEMFGNNRFFAFLSALDHEVQESGGCTSDPLLAFSQFKMASKMAAK